MTDIDSNNLTFEDRVGLKGLFVPSVCVFWLDFFKKATWAHKELLLVIHLCISHINHQKTKQRKGKL